MSRLAHALCALALLAGCGTVAGPAGGEDDLPSSRTGPFRELTQAEMGGEACVAWDPGGLLDEPSAVRLADGRVALYATRVSAGRRGVARVLLAAPGRATGAPADALAATLAWQGDGVSSPDVEALPGGGYAMAYATTSGALGLARSPDGVAWTPLPSPALEADATAGEETALTGPSLVVRPDGTAVLAYASRGAIWLARAPRLDAAFARVDGDPGTPRRDPILGAAGDARPLDGGAPGFESGSVGDPELLVDASALGRTIWRLYYTARAAPRGMDGGVGTSAAVVATAASFDGVTFTRFVAPVFAPRTDATIAAPTALPDGPRPTMLYAGGRCDRSPGGRGLRAGVAPGTDTVAP